MVISPKDVGFLGDGVGLDLAQQAVASDLGMHYSLDSSIEINLDSYYAEKFLVSWTMV